MARLGINIAMVDAVDAWSIREREGVRGSRYRQDGRLE